MTLRAVTREDLPRLLDFWGRGYGRDAARAYKACGFVEEERLREQAWLDGRYVDIVYMGVLRERWRQWAYGPD